jgi:hypothetical protein
MAWRCEAKTKTGRRCKDLESGADPSELKKSVLAVSYPPSGGNLVSMGFLAHSEGKYRQELT